MQASSPAVRAAQPPSEQAATLTAGDARARSSQPCTPLPRPPGCRAFPASPRPGPANLSKRRSGRAWEGGRRRAGTQGPGRVTGPQIRPGQHHLTPTRASKMEGNVRNLNPQLHFRSGPAGRARARRPPPRSTRRKGGRGRGVRPGAQGPGSPARLQRPARGPPPAPGPRSLRRGERPGAASAHLRRAPAGTRTAPGRAPSSTPAAVPRARRCPPSSRALAPRGPAPRSAPPGPAPHASPAPSGASQGSHWSPFLLNRPWRCRLVARGGASAPPRGRAGQPGHRGRRAGGSCGAAASIRPGLISAAQAPAARALPPFPSLRPLLAWRCAAESLGCQGAWRKR